MHRDYCNDFLNTFKISGNATIKCCNDDVPQFNTFIVKWDAYFRQNEMLLNHLVLEVVGKGEIDKVHLNKKKILKLYGISFQLYMKSCRFLSQQPSADYSDCVIIKLE